MTVERNVAQFGFRRCDKSFRTAFYAVSVPVTGKYTASLHIDHNFVRAAEKVVVAR